MADITWYYLDPDNRRKPPIDSAYCCRCMKPIKKDALVVAGYRHPTNPWFRVATKDDADSVIDHDLLGPDCWKIVRSNPHS